SDVQSVLTEPRRVLPGHETSEAHERHGPGETTPVEDLGGEAEPTDAGDSSIGAQARDLRTEGRRVAPRQEVGLHRLERGVAKTDRGQVVGVGPSERPV